MRLSPRILLLLAAMPAAAATSPGDAFPAVAGHLAGDLDLAALDGAPALHWTVTMANVAAVQTVIMVADGPGTQLRVELTFDPSHRPAAWKLVGGSFDLAQWLPAAQHRFAEQLAGLALAGNVSITGRGTLEGTTASGEIVVDVREASVRNPIAGWSLEGISLGGFFGFDTRRGTFHSTAPLALTIRTITTRRFGARNLVLNGVLQDSGHFALQAGRLEIAGGDMVVAPTTIELTPFRIEANVTFNRIGLQDVAALVPSALRSATGRVDGTLRLAWSEATGFQLGTGHLVLRNDEPAEVTLRPFPGLFTSGFQGWLKRIMDAPRWLIRSPLSNLRESELGQAPIEAKSLDVSFSPAPDAQGRYALVKLAGVPKGAGMRTPVDITANIYAPLAPFIDLGAKAKLSFGIH